MQRHRASHRSHRRLPVSAKLGARDQEPQHEVAPSPIHSLALLRDHTAPQAQRAAGLTGLQRTAGNAAVERALAQRQDSAAPAQPTFDLPRLSLDILDLVDVISVSPFDPRLPASLRRPSPLLSIKPPKRIVRWKLKLEVKVDEDSPAGRVFAEGERLQALMAMGRVAEPTAETPLVLRALNMAVSWLPATAVDRFLQSVHVKYLDLIADPSKANYGVSILFEFEL